MRSVAAALSISAAVGVSAEAETAPEVRCALAVDVTLPEGSSTQEAADSIEGYSGARLIAAALAADGLILTVDPVAVTRIVQTPAEDEGQDYAYGVEPPSTLDASAVAFCVGRMWTQQYVLHAGVQAAYHMLRLPPLFLFCFS